MGFLATRFSFDGVWCDHYGLCIYDVDGNNNKATSFASAGKIISDAIPSSGKNYLYGRDLSAPLEFELVFGIDPCLDRKNYFTRGEMEDIANWLTGPKDYRVLTIDQADMHRTFYKCVISELTPIQSSWFPVGFIAKVTCDSPYAYMSGIRMFSDLSGDDTDSINWNSTINATCSPIIRIKAKEDFGTNGRITISDIGNNVLFDLPLPSLARNTIVMVDNEKGIISSSNGDNLYYGFDFNWWKIKPGNNYIKVSIIDGTADVRIMYDVPVNCGG